MVGGAADVSVANGFKSVERWSVPSFRGAGVGDLWSQYKGLVRRAIERQVSRPWRKLDMVEEIEGDFWVDACAHPERFDNAQCPGRYVVLSAMRFAKQRMAAFHGFERTVHSRTRGDRVWQTRSYRYKCPQPVGWLGESATSEFDGESASTDVALSLMGSATMGAGREGCENDANALVKRRRPDHDLLETYGRTFRCAVLIEEADLRGMGEWMRERLGLSFCSLVE